MRKKVLILGLCLLGVTHSLSSKDKKSIPLYKDAKAPIEKRIEDLISRMTMEEKVFQLNQYTLGRNSNVNNVGEELKHFEKQLIKVGETKISVLTSTWSVISVLSMRMVNASLKPANIIFCYRDRPLK